MTEQHDISGAEGVAVLFLGDGTGAFAPGILLQTSGKGEYGVGDFNADGRADLLGGAFIHLNVCHEPHPRRRVVRH